MPRRVEEAEQLAYGVVAVPWVAERQLSVDDVPIAAAGTDLRQIPGLDEIVDDLRGRSLGYPDCPRDISHAARRVACDRFQDVRVVREEPPARVVVEGGLHRSLEERCYEKGCCSSACKSTPSTCATVIVVSCPVRTFRLPSIR